ncbi:MAG: transglutaminase domain-containing protein, partial [Winogradskyella sp.]
ANGVVTKSFTSTWDKVSKTIYESENFGRQLDKSSFFKDDLNALTEGVEDDFQKAFIVENLVKSKVKWNGTYGKYAQKGIRTAYKEGEGNVGDINLLVTAMLRSQGVNANPVLVSTRNNGFPLFPTREGFNYVVCMVVSGDSYMLIDATELYSTNNVLPQRVLNWKGRLLNKDGSSRWVNLESNKKSTESAMLNITLNEDLSATGKVRQNITSYSALNYRKKYTNVSEEDHIKALEANKGDLVISELNFENDKDIIKPVRVSYSYELTDAVDDIGGNLYFTPMLFLGTKESPFKLTERNYPIDFVIPFEDKYLVNIALPEGYKVESLPETLAIEFKGGESKFVYLAKMNGKYLQLKVELEVNNPYVSLADYASFKAFFEKTVEKQAEQIVLTKA